MKTLYNNFIKSFKLLSNWKCLSLGILAEFLFIISVMTSWFFVSNRLIQNYGVLQEMAGSINPESIVDGTGLEVLSSQLGVIKSAIGGIYFNLGIFILLIFLSYVIFEGVSWVIVNCIVNKKKLKFKLNYFLKFSGLSLVWTFLLLLLFYLIVEGMSEDVAVIAGLEIFFIGYLLILIYFAMISYAYFVKNLRIWKSLKSSFVNGIKRVYILFPLFLIIGLVFFLISNFFGLLVGVPLFFIVAVIIFLILCIWARIYLLLIVKEL